MYTRKRDLFTCATSGRQTRPALLILPKGKMAGVFAMQHQYHLLFGKQGSTWYANYLAPYPGHLTHHLLLAVLTRGNAG